MEKYTEIGDIIDLEQAIDQIINLKAEPFREKEIGINKRLILLFFNSSLRTRLSTEIAAKNLGMDVMILNVSDAWKLEFEDGTIMNFDSAEHIKEACSVISEYADIIGIRAFPGLKDKAVDEQDLVLNNFIKYATVPVINLESTLAHPFQALADAVTIKEHNSKIKPKVVLSWAPHPKALPHAVPSSFLRTMKRLHVDLVITHPRGYELNGNLINGVQVNYDQQAALDNADFVYVKNWSSYESYGEVLNQDNQWMMKASKRSGTKVMHCLPARGNVAV